MKLFLLERLRCDYDEVASAVVCAENELMARQMLHDSGTKFHNDNYQKEWLDFKKSSCKELLFDKEEIIHEHIVYG